MILTLALILVLIGVAIFLIAEHTKRYRIANIGFALIAWGAVMTFFKVLTIAF